MINLTGLIFSFIAGKGKNSSNLQTMIARSSLITSTFFIWMLLMNVKPNEHPTKQKLLSLPTKIYKTIESKQIKLAFSEDGFLITEARSLKFPAENILERGFIQVNFLDEEENFLKWDQDFTSFQGEKMRIKLDLTQESNLTKFNFNFEGKRPKYAILHCRVPEGDLFQSEKKTVLGLTNKYLGTYLVLEQSIDTGINKTDVWAKLDLSKSDSIMLVNTSTKATELEAIKPIVDLTHVLRLNSGMFGTIKRFIVYYLLIGFEQLNDILRNPMLVVFLIVIFSRLLLVYPNYRSHIFSGEFNKITGGAAGKDPEIFMAQLKNQKVSFKEQGVWLLLRISILLIMYLIIQISPSFYKSKFLWIDDLSKPDNLNLSNLFGLVPAIQFIPTIGLTPLISTGIIFFELLRKKQPMEPRLLYLLFVITLLVFSRMQSALCLYIAFSTVLDQVQTYLFQLFLSRRSKKRNKGIEKKY